MATSSPEAALDGRSFCVLSPVMITFEPKPILVKNIFICAGVVFCASSSIMKELSSVMSEYNKIKSALGDVKRKGYGIVGPAFDEIILDEPEVFKHGSRYGIKIKAHGEAINMIKTDIETEVAPIVGTEEQSKEFIDDILSTYKTDRQKIWDLNLFGRTLDTLVREGMNNKIYTMPEDAQIKLQESLQKILNEGSGGLICIIL